MAGCKTNYTLREAKDILGQHEVTVTSHDGEYRVNLKGGTEDTAYYTSTTLDAIDTGLAMAKRARELAANS